MTETLNPVTVQPHLLEPGNRLGFKVIAVIGHNNDWSAYRGLSHWTDEQVASQGDKISGTAARQLFHAPPAAGLTYRD